MFQDLEKKLMDLDNKLMGSLYDALTKSSNFLTHAASYLREKFYEARYGEIPKTFDDVIEQAKKKGIGQFEIRSSLDIDYVHFDICALVSIERYAGNRRYDDLVVYARKKRLLDHPDPNPEIEGMAIETVQFQIELAEKLVENGLNFSLKVLTQTSPITTIDGANAKLAYLRLADDC